MKNAVGKERLFERAISAKRMSLVCLLQGTARGYNNSYNLYSKYRYSIEAIQMVGLWKEYVAYYDNHVDYQDIDDMYAKAEKEGAFKNRKEYLMLDKTMREFYDQVREKTYNKSYPETRDLLVDVLEREVKK